MRLSWLALAVGAFLFPQTAHAGGGTYFPLDPGDTWTYDVTSSSYPGGYASSQLVVTATPTSSSATYDFSSFLGAARRVTCSGNNVSVVDSATGQSVVVLELGASSPQWTFTIAGAGYQNVSARFLGKTIALTTARHFADVVEVAFESVSGGVTCSAQLYFASGVGLVSWTETTAFSVVKYDLAGATVGGTVITPLPTSITQYQPLDMSDSWDYSSLVGGVRQSSADCGIWSMAGISYSFSTFLGSARQVLFTDDGALSVQVDATTTTPVFYFDRPTGSTWDFSIPGACTQNVQVTYQGKEIVTTVAGTFVDCARFDFQGTCTSGGIQQIWFAPNVGIVQWVESAPQGPVTLELTQAVIAPFTYYPAITYTPLGTGGISPIPSYAITATLPLSQDDHAVVVGDVNGDGIPDLLVSNFSAKTVSVFLGRGGGTFGPATNLPIALSYDTPIVLGDVNGDGILDLVGLSGDSTVSVWLGDGKGGFAHQGDYATNYAAQVLALADVNGDGALDIAVASLNAATVSILLGDGTGSFGARTDFPTGVLPVALAIADVNGDGKLDIVTANQSGSSVSVLLGDGTGSFARRINFDTGRYPSTIAVADMNGDGHPDLIVGNADSTTVLYGDGTGQFPVRVDEQSTPPNYGGAWLVADMNGDGHPDLVFSWGMFLGDGAGGFFGPVSMPTPSYVAALTTADLSGSGKLDVIAVSPSSVTILLSH